MSPEPKGGPRVALITHEACLRHETPEGHPERVARLEAILQTLSGERFADLIRCDAPRADRAAIARVHDGAYIDAIDAAAPAAGDLHALNPDTFMSHGSLEAAERAAGAVMAAVDGVMAGTFTRAFCAVRPPGHHAEPDKAMGFCLFNNLAVGAYHARAVHGLKRLAIVDFDVHHGNGGQAVAERDGDLFFASIHEGGIYPGTGQAHECGPADNIVNAPVPHLTGSQAWRAALDRVIFPALEAFAPEMIFVSAGFDAHDRDPLATLALTDDDFAWATARLVAIAEQTCDGRLVSTLEGGYDLEALAHSAAAHVDALRGAGLGSSVGGRRIP